jgi:hypothetical protein
LRVSDPHDASEYGISWYNHYCNSHSDANSSGQVHALPREQARLEAAAQQLEKLFPCPPEALQLEPEQAPEALRDHAAFAERFMTDSRSWAASLLSKLVAKNESEHKKWLREKMESGRSADHFVEYLQTAPPVLGLARTHEAAALMFEHCMDEERVQTKRLRVAEARLREELSASRAEIAAAQQESEQLKDRALEFDVEKAHAQLLGEEILTITLAERNAEHRLHFAEGALEAEVTDRANEVTEQRASLLASESQQEALATQLRLELEVAQSKLREQEATERGRLKKTQEEMLQHVESARQRFQETYAEERALRASAEAETAKTQAVADSAKKRETFMDEEMQRLQATHELTLAMRDQGLRAAKSEHFQARQELLEGEKTKVRLELEHESSKRALEVQCEDVRQLAKARRYAEGLTERLTERDTVARTSGALLEEARRRVKTLEEQIRQMETHHAALIRDRDYRIAILEVQVSSARV